MVKNLLLKLFHSLVRNISTGKKNLNNPLVSVAQFSSLQLQKMWPVNTKYMPCLVYFLPLSQFSFESCSHCDINTLKFTWYWNNSTLPRCSQTCYFHPDQSVIVLWLCSHLPKLSTLRGENALEFDSNVWSTLSSPKVV